MNKVALLVALAIAAIGGFLLFVYLQRFEQEASGGPKIKLLVALKPIAIGQTLTEDMLVTREVPMAYVEDRSVRETERPRVIGLRVSTPVQAQQTLMWTDLAIATDDRRDLSDLVQPGMRAVSVRATTENSFALIRPGDRVDVIATMPQAQDQRESVVLLQNVLVLAVGLDMGSEPVKRAHGERTDQMLTLSLNVPEAQLLALAVEKGHLSVALRNPDDVRLAEGLTDMNSTTLTDTKSRTAVQAVRKSGPVRLEAQGAPNP
ncbi:MAG TPA: Flp pilus assembly protein CpaB [Polyangiaceae bacterium]